MSGESFDYDFGVKRNWRRWLWNRIADRLSVPPSEAVVLYLAGQNDFDRSIAISKGFRNENMIAVEKDSSAFYELKKKGILVIHGDLFEILNSWPPNQRIDVIIADLCSGLEARLLNNFYYSVGFPNISNCVFAVNVLRGRDPSSNEFRLGAQGHISPIFFDSKLPQDHKKHRGCLLYSHWLLTATSFCSGRIFIAPDGSYEFNGDKSFFNGYFEYVFLMNHEDSRPDFFSYLSKSHQRFDSVIWKNTMHIYYKEFPEISQQLIDRHRKKASDRRLLKKRRSISALLAHRTMRREKIGVYSS